MLSADMRDAFEHQWGPGTAKNWTGKWKVKAFGKRAEAERVSPRSSGQKSSLRRCNWTASFSISTYPRLLHASFSSTLKLHNGALFTL